MKNSKSKNIHDSVGNYYASNRAAAFMKYNNDNKSDGDWIRDLNFKRRSVWPVLRVHSFYWANCGCEP